MVDRWKLIVIVLTSDMIWWESENVQNTPYPKRIRNFPILANRPVASVNQKISSKFVVLLHASVWNMLYCIYQYILKQFPCILFPKFPNLQKKVQGFILGTRSNESLYYGVSNWVNNYVVNLHGFLWELARLLLWNILHRHAH